MQTKNMTPEALQLCSQVMGEGNDWLDKSISSSFSQQYADSKYPERLSAEMMMIPETVDAACYAITDTKATSSQTTRNKKVKDKTTSTKAVQLMPVIENIDVVGQKKHVCDIHAIITVNVATSHQVEDIPINTEDSCCSAMVKKEASNKRCNMKKLSKCTCTLDEYERCGVCADTCTYSCKYGGYGPCSRFTLGTADYRHVQKEKCNTMLIGGCRVPVCKNFKNRF